MDARAKMAAVSVRRFREAKSWSQQHLADASGVSLRTVQRLEAQGTASAETRLAIASALGISAQTLAVTQEQADAEECATTRSTLVFASSGISTLFVLGLGSLLPATVASHFDITGAPDAYFSREAFVLAMSILVSALPSLAWWGVGWSVRAGNANLPNATYWLAPERRERTERILLRHGALLAVLLSTFLCFVYGLVVYANLAEGGARALNLGATLSGLAVFLAGVTLWLHALERLFRRSGA